MATNVTHIEITQFEQNSRVRYFHVYSTHENITERMNYATKLSGMNISQTMVATSLPVDLWLMNFYCMYIRR